MTEQPPGGRPEQLKEKRRGLDPGAATVWAAAIALVGVVAGGFIGHFLPDGATGGPGNGAIASVTP